MRSRAATNSGAQWMLKLERLRRSIDTGLADLDRGDYEEVDDSDLEAWLDRVAEPARS